MWPHRRTWAPSSISPRQMAHSGGGDGGAGAGASRRERRAAVPAARLAQVARRVRAGWCGRLRGYGQRAHGGDDARRRPARAAGRRRRLHAVEVALPARRGRTGAARRSPGRPVEAALRRGLPVRGPASSAGAVTGAGGSAGSAGSTVAAAQETEAARGAGGATGSAGAGGSAGRGGARARARGLGHDGRRRRVHVRSFTSRQARTAGAAPERPRRRPPRCRAAHAATGPVAVGPCARPARGAVRTRRSSVARRAASGPRRPPTRHPALPFEVVETVDGPASTAARAPVTPPPLPPGTPRPATGPAAGTPGDPRASWPATAATVAAAARTAWPGRVAEVVMRPRACV